MSFIEKFNYNRDSITSGSVLGFTGSPIYGASMQFEASNSSWRGSNYNQFIMANGINSIKVNMDFSFQGNEQNMKSVLRRIENATTGSQNIIIKQGSGATITIPSGQVKAVFSDGTGAGAAMTDAFTGLSVPSLFIAGQAPASIGDVLALSIALG